MGRARLLISMALGACLVALLGLPAVVAAASATTAPVSVTADLQGRAIAVSDIPDWYCYDRDYPRIHCFASPAALAHALATRQRAEVSAFPAGSATYLWVYSQPSFQGGYTTISQAYDDLRTIGWDNRISSFKAVNGIAGHFATDIYDSGAYYYFSPNQQTTYVGNSWNHTFSSVYPW